MVDFTVFFFILFNLNFRIDFVDTLFLCSYFVSGLVPLLTLRWSNVAFNPIELRTANTSQWFGRSECSRVKIPC